MALPNEIHPFAIAGGGNQYQVANSLRFRGGNYAHLAKNGSYTTPIFTNGTTFTISAWIKMGIPFSTNAADFMTFVYTSGNGEQGGIGFGSNGTAGQIGWWEYNAPSGYFIRKWSTLLLRDPSAWYHCVWVYDSTNATAEDRVRIYVNNTRVTSWSINTNPSQNRTSYFVSNASGYYPIIGGQNRNGAVLAGYNFDGNMCEVYGIDGQALDPSYFGQTDSVTGTWNPKKYTGTYGTNGYYLPFKNQLASTYSASFNGSSQSLVTQTSTNLALGTSDFTIEYWMNASSKTNGKSPFTSGPGTVTYDNLFGYFDGTNFLYYLSSTGSSWDVASGRTIISNADTGRWYHIAFTRSGSTFRTFVDGVQKDTFTSASSLYQSANQLCLGRTQSTNYYSGSLSNFRFIKGTALYTSNFTPSNSPLTAVTNTQLLTLQDATIIDNSTNAFTITNNGTVTTSIDYPFGRPNISADESGNNNHWVANGITISSPANTVTYLHDSYIDTPTPYNDGSTTYNRGNYPTLNSVDPDGGSYAINGNLQTSGSPTGGGPLPTIALPKTGKWLFEAVSLGNGGSGIVGWFGVANADAGNFSGLLSRIAVNPGNGYYQDDALVQSGYIGGNNIVYTMAIDIDNKILYIYFDGVYQRSLTITSADVNLFMFYSGYTGSTGYVNYGQRPFRHPQTGYLALNTYNLPNPSLPLV